MKPHLCISSLLLAGMVAALPAHASLESELKRIEADLEKIASSRETNRESGRARAIQQVNAAGQSDGAASIAYGDAHRDTELAGKIGQGAEFQEWKKKNEGWLNSPEFRAAVRLHLRYLALTLERAGSDEPEKFVAPSVDYLKALADAREKWFYKQKNTPGQQNDLLRGNVTSGIFARAWRLQPYFTGLKDWALSPGNPEEILDKNVRAVFVKEKNPELLKTWDWQIELEKAEMKDRRGDHALAEFETRRLPSLEFNKARAAASIGDFPTAIRGGFNVLRAQQEHPDFEKWVDEVRQWIGKAKPSEAATKKEEPEEAPPAENAP